MSPKTTTQSGALELDDLGDPTLKDVAVRRPQVERVRRFAQAELVVEDRGHRGVVVLP